ncbi:MAG: type VII secretion integral membrane protein EccD, partial [Actinocatenispora sp.]
VLAAVAVADRLAWFVGVAVAAAIGGLATTFSVLLGGTPVATAAVTVALATALSPALPMLALRLGRLPLPRVPSDVAAFRADERPTFGSDVLDETGTAEDALTGLLGALSALVVGGGAVLLALGDSRWGWTLAGVAGVALVLRSRSYAGTAQRLVLLIAGLGTLIGTGLRLNSLGDDALWLVLVLLAALVGVGCTVYSSRAIGRDASPYWSRLLDIAEFLSLISLIPLAAAVLDIYGKVRSLGG